MKATQFVQQCTAGITINRNKIKKYNDNQFYLKDKQEFEIEIRNTLSFTVLATIKINGSLISNSGLVIKPGQKVYLERYIDTNKKFLFETYQVEDNQATFTATANNGNVEIMFYKEKQTPQINHVPISWVTTTTPSAPPAYGSTNNCYYGASGSSSLYNNTVGSTAYRRITGTSNYQNIANTLTSNNIPTTDWFEQSDEKFRETGRVEKGSTSKQEFTNYQGDFESHCFQIVKLKLLPFSTKPLEINELAQYCTECGTKNKKGNYKFCPKCGTKY